MVFKTLSGKELTTNIAWRLIPIHLSIATSLFYWNFPLKLVTLRYHSFIQLGWYSTPLWNNMGDVQLLIHRRTILVIICKGPFTRGILHPCNVQSWVIKNIFISCIFVFCKKRKVYCYCLLLLTFTFINICGMHAVILSYISYRWL